ncbi:simple sugar transport system permease protein [Paenibacillus uliginis N3/975]|uniref:Simple sugar transport system permease protein n=1 Tax=Paenibacillus uliginis N3/975 TaxID=1313296 RepID=A0A1X7HPH4_9BACL|nr:simple sugar transport system permease protein [Paenibacillus uliginis N3/975]
MNTARALQEKPARSAFDFLYKYGTIITVVVLIAVFGILNDNFLNTSNIINILRSISIVTIIAVGLTVSLAVGGFDLSVGSTASLANALVISLFVWRGTIVLIDTMSGKSMPIPDEARKIISTFEGWE